MSDALSYRLQRLSALVIAPMVLLHLAVILYAISGGLSAEEILSRTRSSLLWPVFYTAFVIAVAIHAPLGLRNIAREWLASRHIAIDIAALVFFIILLLTGLRAVMAIA